MSRTLDEFVRDFRAEVGDIGDVIRNANIGAWVNEGQARLRVYRQLVSSISWAAGDAFLAMPADFHHAEDIAPDGSGSFPAYRTWGTQLRYAEPARSGGTGTLYYWANWPTITASQPSLLPDLGNQAALSFALYRFFKRLSSSRADYRMYASIAQANGVGVDELANLAEQHLQDFEDARTALGELLMEPVTFFSD